MRPYSGRSAARRPDVVVCAPSGRSAARRPDVVVCAPSGRSAARRPDVVVCAPSGRSAARRPYVVVFAPSGRTSARRPDVVVCAPSGRSAARRPDIVVCAPIAVAQPPAVQTPSCAPLAVAQPFAVQTSSCAPLAVALPSTALTTSSCATIALPPERVTWSTVVRSRPKRSASLIATGKPQPSNTKSKPVIIGTARATGIAAVEKRKRRANIFASRFAPDQCHAVALKRYLDAAFRTSVTCTKLDTKHPDDYSSFLVVAEVDNPRSLLDGQLWPENISVRWYRPASNNDDRESQERVAQPSYL